MVLSLLDDDEIKGEKEKNIPNGYTNAIQNKQLNAQMWHKETNMSFTIARKIVRSKDNLWKVIHRNMSSTS